MPPITGSLMSFHLAASAAKARMTAGSVVGSRNYDLVDLG
jgi:hypothetical protein